MVNELVQEKAKKKYRKAFRAHMLEIFPLYQSKKVEIAGQRYTVIGQFLLEGSPLYTQFDVVNEYCESTDKESGKQIFLFVTMHQIASTVFPTLQNLLEEQRKRQDPSATTAIENNDLKFLLSTKGELDKIIHSLEVTVEQARQMQKVNIWSESDLEALQQKWNVCWEIYAKRMEPLLRLAVLAKKDERLLLASMSVAEQQWIKALLREASLIAQLSSSLAPTEEPIFKRMDELMEASYQLGRVTQQETPTIKLKSSEKVLYRLLTFFMKCFFFVIFPLILLIVMIDGFSYSLLFLPGMYIFVYSPIFKQYKQKLQRQKSFEIQLKNKQLLFPVNGFDSKEALKKPTSPEILNTKEMYSVKGSLLNIGLAAMYVTISIFVVMICFWFVSGWGNETKITLIITIIAAVFSMLLPYLKISQKQITLYDNYVVIGKSQFYANQIKEVIWDEQKGNLKLEHTDHDVSSELVINKEERKKTTAALREWIHVIKLPYKEITQDESSQDKTKHSNY